MLHNLPNFARDKKEALFFSSLFILLWAYVIIKANTVFYIHDELVTKWAYMISWNPFPYHGYVDANNHFLNSLLGGFFIRLFQSDAMWIVRLPNILSFPLYFFSVIGFKKFFIQKNNFYLLLILLTFTPFIIDYFSVARGYGISLALLVFALQQTLSFLKYVKLKHFLGALISWILSIYANMTLIPFALAGIIYLTVFLWKHHRKKWIIASLSAIFPLAYAIRYSFHLKDIGKLYIGDKKGFFDTTIHSLTHFLWNIESFYLDIALSLITLFIIFSVLWFLSNTKSLFSARLVFPLFFLLGVANILGQHWLLGINYPLDRAALYLIIFFFGGLCFTLDYWEHKWLAYPLIILNLAVFAYHFSLEKSISYPNQHFDKKLLTNIPKRVKGTPPSTGGSTLRTIDELTRINELPVRAFQKLDKFSDTLLDYIVTNKNAYPYLDDLYSPVYKDKISGLILYERNRFLPRKKLEKTSDRISGTNQYFNLYKDTFNDPLYITCSGNLGNINLYTEVILSYAVNDSNNKQLYSERLPLVKSCKVNNKGEITFNVTLTIDDYPGANKVTVYLWNIDQKKLNGTIDVSVYGIR